MAEWAITKAKLETAVIADAEMGLGNALKLAS
jgi:hypothetical protein